MKKTEIGGEHCYMVDLKFTDDCAFKNIRATMLLSKIGQLAEVVKTFPDDKELDEEKLSHGFRIAVTSKFDANAIEKCTKEICEVEQVVVASLDPNALHISMGKAAGSGIEETKLFTELRL
jgi:hypothetical protein